MAQNSNEDKTGLSNVVLQGLQADIYTSVAQKINVSLVDCGSIRKSHFTQHFFNAVRSQPIIRQNYAAADIFEKSFYFIHCLLLSGDA